MPNRDSRALLRSIALGVGAPVVAAMATSVFWSWLQPSVLLFSYPAVMLAALYGGYGAGVAAAVLAVILGTYFHIPPANSFAVGFTDALRMVMFLVAALVTASLVAARTRAEARHRRAIADLNLALDQLNELRDTLEQRVTERTTALEATNTALQQEIQARSRLSEQLVRVQERERRYLARELHDQVGQALTGLKLTLEAPLRGRAAAPVAIGRALELVDSLTSQIRDLSVGLRPSVLDDLGLVHAVLWLIDRYTAQTGVKVSFTHVGLEERLSGNIETAAFRIVQEALTNVARHAGVGEATVWIRRDQAELAVIVEDAGRGFDADALPPSAGMTGMRERVALLGGTLAVIAGPGTGTQITAVFPLAAVEARHSA